MTLIRIMPSRGSINRQKIEDERKAEMEKVTKKLPDRKATHVQLREDQHMLAAYSFDPDVVNILFEKIEELPIGVQQHPPFAQRAFYNSFNLNLLRYGSEGFAFKAATRALRNAIDRIKQQPQLMEA